MTTSDYLKAQADLLVAAELVRRLDLDGFVRKADEAAETGLLDHQGLPVATDAPRMKRLAEGAKQWIENGDGHAKSKATEGHLGRCA